VPIDRVAVIGLDCAEPSLAFERWAADLPNLSALRNRGCFGELTSCLPPITVPAWSCMASSKDPGQLGIYGFRNRRDYSYDGLSIAMSTAVREPRVWDILTEAGLPSIVVGVPGTFPITRPPLGQMITCFLTPDPADAYGSEEPGRQFTHPPALKHTLREVVGEYMVDVKGFRTDNKAWLLEQIYLMTNRRHQAVMHLAAQPGWKLLWSVEMGTDRIHHGFWQFMDEKHHRYEKGNPFESAIHRYYIHLDRQIGEMVQTLDPSRTAFLVVSDHGAKRMDGGLCFNDWLIREGYLVMKERPAAATKFEFKNVDWPRTKVWGEGGYYGRCFINLQGREPQGVVPRDQYESLRAELIRRLEALPDHEGRAMGTRAYRPEDIYRKVNGVAPDLIVIFGDLHWRSVGTVGNEGIYTFKNDTGPDDANHAQQGMYILALPDGAASPAPRGRIDGPTLYDIAPTILKLLGRPVPPDMIGRPLI
jgi:predicted AlkP superfamily phosphohydrolase/phosphomutase